MSSLTFRSAVDCEDPSTPDGFREGVATAIEISGDLPSGWADSSHIARIVCWQGTDFDVGFADSLGKYHDWYGIFAMTTQEVRTIAGPWMTGDREAFRLSTKCFVWGWAKCSRTTENSRLVQQLIAGLRWIWLNYGRPNDAWNHIARSGRFTSYPREGTYDTATTSPFAVCPVDGSVTYSDDFGDPRYVGGYHPHWGNDIYAPRGREIRAPFGGLVVKHSDDWFAGNYVTLLGARGYVRNAHLDRFGSAGYVPAGTVIGYVGDSGDASSPEDHFEWHPWAVPDPLHEAPSGFSRVLDAIDPYPFLKKAC